MPWIPVEYKGNNKKSSKGFYQLFAYCYAMSDLIEIEPDKKRHCVRKEFINFSKLETIFQFCTNYQEKCREKITARTISAMFKVMLEEGFLTEITFYDEELEENVSGYMIEPRPNDRKGKFASVDGVDCLLPLVLTLTGKQLEVLFYLKWAYQLGVERYKQGFGTFSNDGIERSTGANASRDVIKILSFLEEAKLITIEGEVQDPNNEGKDVRYKKLTNVNLISELYTPEEAYDEIDGILEGDEPQWQKSA